MSDSWDEAEITILRGVWKTPTLKDDFEGFKTAVEEAIVHVVETARKLISTHYKTLTDKELMLMYEQRKQLLEMETTPGEDALKIVNHRSGQRKYNVSLEFLSFPNSKIVFNALRLSRMPINQYSGIIKLENHLQSPVQ